MATYLLRAFKVNPEGNFEEYPLPGNIQGHIQAVTTACVEYLGDDEGDWSPLFDEKGEGDAEDPDEYERRFLRYLKKMKPGETAPTLPEFEIDTQQTSWEEIVTMCGDCIRDKLKVLVSDTPIVLSLIIQAHILEQRLYNDLHLTEVGLEVMDSHRVYVGSEEILFTGSNDARGPYLRRFEIERWDKPKYDWSLLQKPPENFNDLVLHLRDIIHRQTRMISPVEMILIPRLLVSRGWVDLYKEIFGAEWELLQLHSAVKQLQNS